MRSESPIIEGKLSKPSSPSQSQQDRPSSPVPPPLPTTTGSGVTSTSRRLRVGFLSSEQPVAAASASASTAAGAASSHANGHSHHHHHHHHRKGHARTHSRTQPRPHVRSTANTVDDTAPAPRSPRRKMAYAPKFNPDALPAHAEPDQAANMLAYGTASPQPPPPPSDLQPNQRIHPPSQSPSPRPAHHPPTQLSYETKPPPPLPSPHSTYEPSDGQTRPYRATSAPQHVPGAYPSNGSSHGTAGKPMTSSHAGDAQQQHASHQRPSYQTPAPHSPLLNPTSTPSQAAQRPGRTLSPRPETNHGPGSGSGPGPSHSASLGSGFGASGGSSSDASLFPLFKAVDVKGTGQLGEEELSRALVNGDFSSFDPGTLRLMIRMFDRDHRNTLTFEEFCNLWGFLGAWRALFERFDADRSGYISLNEYATALQAFGYTLSPDFVRMMYNLYDRRRRQAAGGGGSSGGPSGMPAMDAPDGMSFDLFVQSCISLKRMTDVFKKYDTDRDGFITLSFEDFLREILHQR